jgi:hypothetical protein
MPPSYLVLSFDFKSSFSLPKPQTAVQNPYLDQLVRKEEVKAVEVVAGEPVEDAGSNLTKRGFP